MPPASQVARDAWHIFINHTRSDMYLHMDSVLAEAKTRWRSYPHNRSRFDMGPYQLHTIDWYLINRNWTGWLKVVSTWAEHCLTELDNMVKHLDTMCFVARVVFRGRRETAMDETLYLALEETRVVLFCFCHGWETACRNMTLREWCALGSTNSAASRWNISLAAREDALMRQQAVSNVAPL